ncbi:zinc-binding dehydrogenase [Streptomyces sp. NPDC102462]|uniref:zinc-binding dehydrogenase n=1 Tax=Streptomyces sp. NPDC102462 TaxID=3366178 RepID=UPI003815AEE3
MGERAVKLAAALGAEVTVLSRSTAKEQDARRMGATRLLVTADEAQVVAARGRFDFILDTISADHELSPLIGMLGLDGTLCVLSERLLLAAWLHRRARPPATPPSKFSAVRVA